jgi:hypothetical protein
VVCLLEWRNLLCGVMVVVLPTSLMAQDSARAMLHHNGGVSVNGNPAPKSTAIFPHDLIQTQKGSIAKIEVYGSEVEVQSETSVQFEGDELILEHGSVQVNTSYEMRVRVSCLTVTPLARAWTLFDVTDVDGKVNVAAHEDDVEIHYRGAALRQSKESAFSDVIVHHGEQATREERCGALATPSQPIDAGGKILTNPWVVGAGAVAIGVLTCWALCRGGEPVSPAGP